MTRFQLSPEAEGDLNEIKRYLVQQGGKKLALHVLRQIRFAMRFLATTPGAGHLRNDLTAEPVKFWTVFSYMIVYDPAARPVSIARVLHASQDLERLLKGDEPAP